MKRIVFLFAVASIGVANAQSPADAVNVFLGSSGDHGQMSPGASAPFSMMSICPQTYPHLHMGYEHKAKTILGFTHNRFEGVGCMGSGGNIMITPFYGNADSCTLTKIAETASPGYYHIAFTNGIEASFAVNGKAGVELYSFLRTNASTKGFVIDLSHTLANKFIAEQHHAADNHISGWIESATTCSVGIYRVYYYLETDDNTAFTDNGNHQLTAVYSGNQQQLSIRIAFSAVDEAHARADVSTATITTAKAESHKAWNDVLGVIKVKGGVAREKLFYSLLYRTLQSPYQISEPDGSYRATDGSLQKAKDTAYNGWAIWDNYRTQLPLLSILYPDRYKGISQSIAALYKHGKHNFATQHEPSNTVRTEHAIVVLLDAYRKGYPVDFGTITDSLIAETDRLDFTHPDKALESSYDTWALSEILSLEKKTTQSGQYKQKALEWRKYWDKDFKDMSLPDIDKIGARGMYQGTVWQYRWLVPFDEKGLVTACGGEQIYTQQLDQFFGNDYYNHANETDIQVPLMYNFTGKPWLSQDRMHKYAADTVVQYYFNDNSRGIDPFVGVIYRNEPDTYVRTMDDDAGAMSAWYVFAAIGLSPACVGWPVYYLNLPLFEEVTIHPGNNPFIIRTQNLKPDSRYIQSATLNGKPLERNWIKHQEIMEGGTLVITASDKPDKQWGTKNQFITHLD